MKLVCIITAVTALASVAAVFIFILVIDSIFQQDPEEEAEGDPICEADECNQTTEKKTKEVDVNACNDFYSEVCGTLPQTQTLPTDALMNERSKILTILNESLDQNMTKAESVVRGLYSTCQKHEPEDKDLQIILELFRKSGGFPVLGGDTFDNSKWSWLEMTKKLKMLGLFTDSFFTTSLGSHPLDLRNITFYIQNPRLDIVLKNYRRKGHEYMVSFVYEFSEVAMKFGAAREMAVTDGIELFILEKKLLNIIWKNPRTSKESLAKEPMRTVASLSSTFGFVNWNEYFTSLLGSQEYVTDELVVVVENPGYLRNLKQVLDETPNRILANFMMWSMLFRLKEYMPGYKRSTLECYKFLENTMPYGLQLINVNTTKINDEKSEKIVLQIATKIKEGLLKRVSSSDWIINQTKKELVEKITNIKIKVGYPQILLNMTFIDEYYENLSLSDNALESMLAVQKFHVDKYFNLCCRRVEEVFLDFSGDSFLPLVYYDSARNSIHIPQRALQEPIFNPERPLSENFGMIGSMIAHEMVHAVDLIGYRYNGEGIRKSSSEDAYLKEFEKKSHCFVDRYNSFLELRKDVLAERPWISGEFEKLEIIADSIALDLAFTAFKMYEKEFNISDITDMPSDWGFTPEQMLFVSFARRYCVLNGEAELSELLGDHAPHPYRVIGPITHSDHFGLVFDCQTGSNMNPERKCTLW